jgi:hypothetical protein
LRRIQAIYFYYFTHTKIAVGASFLIKHKIFSTVGWDVLKLGRFGAWFVLELGSFGVRTFWGLGRFGAGTVWGWDVL